MILTKTITPQQAHLKIKDCHIQMNRATHTSAHYTPSITILLLSPQLNYDTPLVHHVCVLPCRECAYRGLCSMASGQE